MEAQPPPWSNVFDAIVALSAVLTAIAAWLGLRTWLDKLWGEENYRIAKAVLLGCSRLTRAINSWRKPQSRIIELQDLNEETAEELQGPVMNRIIKAYREQGKRADEALEDLEEAVFEADVLWKTDLMPEVQVIGKLVDGQHRDTERHLDRLQHGNPIYREPFPDKAIKLWPAVRASLWREHGESDPRGDALFAAIETIRDTAQARLDESHRKTTVLAQLLKAAWRTPV